MIAPLALAFALTGQVASLASLELVVDAGVGPGAIVLGEGRGSLPLVDAQLRADVILDDTFALRVALTPMADPFTFGSTVARGELAIAALWEPRWFGDVQPWGGIGMLGGVGRYGATGTIVAPDGGFWLTGGARWFFADPFALHVGVDLPVSAAWAGGPVATFFPRVVAGFSWRPSLPDLLL